LDILFPSGSDSESAPPVGAPYTGLFVAVQHILPRTQKF
jgi:hypothetical protein